MPIGRGITPRTLAGSLGACRGELSALSGECRASFLLAFHQGVVPSLRDFLRVGIQSLCQGARALRSLLRACRTIDHEPLTGHYQRGQWRPAYATGLCQQKPSGECWRNAQVGGVVGEFFPRIRAICTPMCGVPGCYWPAIGAICTRAIEREWLGECRACGEYPRKKATLYSRVSLNLRGKSASDAGFIILPFGLEGALGPLPARGIGPVCIGDHGHLSKTFEL